MVTSDFVKSGLQSTFLPEDSTPQAILARPIDMARPSSPDRPYPPVQR